MLDDRETETRAFRLAGNVRVECLLDDVAREARPVIGDCDFGESGVGAVHVASRDLDARIRLRLQRFDRVAQQVVQHLTQPASVGVDGWQIRCK